MSEHDGLVEYWQKERVGVVERLAAVRQRRLDRERTLADNACFAVALSLTRDFIELTLVEAEELADKVLDAAEFYFLTAIERDDLWVYRREGQEDLGRAERLKGLTTVRWFKNRSLELSAFRQAVDMKERWNEQVFSQYGWEATGFALDEWMAEKIIAGDPSGAFQAYEQYARLGSSRRNDRQSSEKALALVASTLASPGDRDRHREAEIALDALYQRLTAWTEPGARPRDVLLDEKFLYAYIRAKDFKGEEDPIRIIERMRWRQ